MQEEIESLYDEDSRLDDEIRQVVSIKVNPNMRWLLPILILFLVSSPLISVCWYAGKLKRNYKPSL